MQENMFEINRIMEPDADQTTPQEESIIGFFKATTPQIMVSQDVFNHNLNQLNELEKTYASNPCRCLHRQNACGTCMGCNEITNIHCVNIGCPEFVCKTIKVCDRCGKNMKVFY